MRVCFFLGVSFLAILGQAFDVSGFVARKGALARECFTVVDDLGCPVPNAIVACGLQLGPGMNDYSEIRKESDNNGKYVVEGWIDGIFHYLVTKQGYYATQGDITFSSAFRERRQGRWLPFGCQRKIILKKIRNPVKLSWTEDRHFKIPVFDQWVGFDLETCRWVPPFGEGQHSDVLLRFHARSLKSYLNFSASMEVCFTNNPHAGFCQMNRDCFLKWGQSILPTPMQCIGQDVLIMLSGKASSAMKRS